MDKLKIGFEVTDNWKNGNFREFIQGLIKSNNFDVYIISNDDISSYIYSVGEQLQLPNNRVIVTNFTNDKINEIITNNINIYFDNLQHVVTQIDAETNCYAILINILPNRYLTIPTYQVEFFRILTELNEKECK